MSFIIIALIACGLLLFIVEVVFIPGTTIVGIFGLLMMVVGVVFSFSRFGTETGVWVLTGTAVVTGLSLYLSFRSGAWKRFSLKGAITSKVNEGQLAELAEGEEGIAISTLRPSGKAEFRNKVFEVNTFGDYINPGTRIKIIKLQGNQIIVEPIN